MEFNSLPNQIIIRANYLNIPREATWVKREKSIYQHTYTALLNGKIILTLNYNARIHHITPMNTSIYGG